MFPGVGYPDQPDPKAQSRCLAFVPGVGWAPVPGPTPRTPLDKRHSYAAGLPPDPGPALMDNGLLPAADPPVSRLRFRGRSEEPHPQRGHHEAGPRMLRISPEEEEDIVTV